MQEDEADQSRRTSESGTLKSLPMTNSTFVVRTMSRDCTYAGIFERSLNRGTVTGYG